MQGRLSSNLREGGGAGMMFHALAINALWVEDRVFVHTVSAPDGCESVPRN
jgi:hypothetical protein